MKMQDCVVKIVVNIIGKKRVRVARAGKS